MRIRSAALSFGLFALLCGLVPLGTGGVALAAGPKPSANARELTPNPPVSLPAAGSGPTQQPLPAPTPSVTPLPRTGIDLPAVLGLGALMIAVGVALRVRSRLAAPRRL